MEDFTIDPIKQENNKNSSKQKQEKQKKILRLNTC